MTGHGFNDQTVEQDGTFAHCGGAGNTTPKYQAWYEMYPAGSVNVFNVKGVGGFANNYPIDMIDPLSSGGFDSLDTVGALSGKTFTATWDRSGNTVPITL